VIFKHVILSYDFVPLKPLNNLINIFE